MKALFSFIVFYCCLAQSCSPSLADYPACSRLVFGGVIATSKEDLETAVSLIEDHDVEALAKLCSTRRVNMISNQIDVKVTSHFRDLVTFREIGDYREYWTCAKWIQ